MSIRRNFAVILFAVLLMSSAPMLGQDERASFGEHVLTLKVQPLKAPKPGEKLTTKLAPELAAIKVTGGKLVGMGEKNTAIVSFANPEALDAAVKALGATEPRLEFTRGMATAAAPKVNRLTRIIISYRLADVDGPKKAPLTTAELEKLGLVLEETLESVGSSIVKVPDGLTKDTVVALESNDRVVFVEPDYVISIPLPVPTPDEGKEAPKDPPKKEPEAPKLSVAPTQEKSNESDEFADPSEPNVGLRISPTGISSLAIFPNDPQFSQQWGLQNIHAPDAWDSVTNATRIVAVIDTGIDSNHPQVRGNLWVNVAERSGTAGVDDDGNGQVDDIHGFDFARGDGDPDDENLATAPFPLGHGTHVTGTVAAVGNDNLGVSGVVWRGQVMCLKFMTPRHVTLPNGTVIASASGSTANELRCINYAIRNGATVINASFGRSGSFSTAEFNAIAAARDRGIIFVAAAGNDTTDTDATPHYPSSYGLENVISVAAINRLDQLAGFSNFGSVSVDLAAPGVGILSTVPAWSANFPTANASGTSMASPHVAGAAALIWNHPDHAGRSWKEIIGLILANSRSLASLSGRCVTGATLDLEFLAPPVPDAGEAYRALPSTIVRGPRNLGSLTIQLDDEMFVHIRAEYSAQLRYPSRGKGVTVGISDSPTLGAIKSESARRYRFEQRGDADQLQSSLGVKLPPGTHRFFFQIAPDDLRGISLSLGRGNIMIEAFGKKIGGDL